MTKVTIKGRSGAKEGQLLQFIDGEWVNRTIEQILEDYDFPVGGEGGLTEGDKGDITVTTTSPLTLTIDNDVVSNAKMANMAESTIKGRASGSGTGDPVDLTAAQARTILNVANGATANQTDAHLLARANHTGEQAIATVTGLQTALDGKEPAKGADDNFVTDAEKTKLSNLSGTNSGDQTSIVGISGTLAEFNTACSDANFASGGGTASGTNTGDETAARIAALIVAASGKAAPVDTDSLAIIDSEDSNSLKEVTFANLRAFFDDFFQSVLVNQTNIKSLNGNSLLGAGDLSITASDPAYATGSFTVSTGTSKFLGKRLQLTTDQRSTIAGTSRLRVTN